MTSVTRPMVDNIPAERTTFVGRRSEVADIKQAFVQSRLVTLVGMGGVGKTRLAIHAAVGLRRAFQDGAWFVDLSTLSGEDLLVSTVAGALHLQSRSRGWAPAALTRHLAEREMLLVLDNCEQIRDACAVLVDSLLPGCPALRVLVTSRQALEVPGEQLVTVLPLATPGPGERCTSQQLQAYDAVALFAERARAVAPGFRVTDENQTSVAALCRRLDGIPLALELAAARLRVLSPQQILDRLDERSALLRSGSTVATERHRSLQSLIEWSYGLCSTEQKTLWARLTVFPGTFDLSAAEVVCAGDDLPQDWVLDLLTGLVDKSILLTESGADPVRYRMPETIRDFGREQLTVAGEELTLRRRHRDHFAVLYLASEPWFGAHQEELLGGTRLDRDNYRAALDFSLSEPGELVPGVMNMTMAVAAEAMVRGFLSEGRRWVRRVLDVAELPAHPRAQLLWVDGLLALNQGDIDGGESRLRECRELAEQIGDSSDAAYARAILGMSALMRGDVLTARRLCEDALKGLQRNHNALGFVLASTRLGFATFLLGDADTGAQLIEDAIAECEKHGEMWNKADALADLGKILWRRGDTRRASELATEGLRIQVVFDNAVGTAQFLELFAWIAASEGRHGRSARLLGAADRLWHAIDAALFTYLRAYREETEQQVRRALGTREFEAEHRRGLEGPTADNVSFALGEQEQPPRQDSGSADPLTPREREIAELIADGLTNKDIATTLVISPRTAEGHVDHILTKLGYTSRAQVAVWVTERRNSAAGG